jgi:hypothetical protein
MTGTWQQAVDPALAGRLWRRGERPGVIRHEPAAAILSRHRGMVSGLPLADMLLRRQEVSNDPGVALDEPLPVVTASLPATAVPDPAGPGARAASPDPAESSPPAGPATQPVPVTPVRSSADAVVQRMPAAAAPLAPSPDLPLSPGPLLAGPLPDGALASGPLPGGSLGNSSPGDGGQMAGPPLTPPAAAAPAVAAPADGPRIRAVPGLPATADVPRELPWAEEGPGRAAPAALPVVVATPVPDQRPVTAARPLVLVSAPRQSADPGSPPRGGTGDRGHASYASSREPAPRASDRGPSLVVVRERPRRVSGAGLAADPRRAPLPLAGIAVPGTADPARPSWPPHPAPAPPPAARPAAMSQPQPGSTSGQGHAAQQRNGSVRPQPGPDAGRIAETVRRRFLRELSIEAERRGAGWES